MSMYTTRASYIEGFQKVIEKTTRETKELESYLAKQIQRLDEILDQISKENFWQLVPEIMGIDARLSLLTELLKFKFEDFSDEEIIRITENDYRTYLKDLCGYSLSEETNHSLVFNVV
ncbi:DUF7006 family protein [Enterococcus mundtii]|uniref:DUF7006 family protein n=1 Tax=Enterococcus mundtii TaxID=53346 RepID=UPI001377C506|nr:hypothetical protein [Enterococcus mundtii]NBA63774.1 hypothetical protein [Enterococcus mundtii]